MESSSPINLTSQFPFKGLLGDIFFSFIHFIIEHSMRKQLSRLIWVCTVCLCPNTRVIWAYSFQFRRSTICLIFWSEPSSTILRCTCEQRRFSSNCVDAQARLIYSWSPIIVIRTKLICDGHLMLNQTSYAGHLYGIVFGNVFIIRGC